MYTVANQTQRAENDKEDQSHTLTTVGHKGGNQPLTPAADNTVIANQPLTPASDNTVIAYQPLTPASDNTVIANQPLTPASKHCYREPAPLHHQE